MTDRSNEGYRAGAEFADSTGAEVEPVAEDSISGAGTSGSAGAVATARREAGRVTESAKEQVGQVADVVGRQARGLVDETRAQLRAQAQEQTERVGVTLSDLAQQLRGMAENAPDPSSTVAGLANDGARRLDLFADQLRSGGFDGLLSDLRRLARRRPAAFLAGAAAAGVVAGRIFRNVDLSSVEPAGTTSSTGEMAGSTGDGQDESPSRSDGSTTFSESQAGDGG